MNTLDISTSLFFGYGKKQISFSKNGACFYQTELSNSDFIVIYNYEYYINYEKYSDLVKKASAPEIVSKPVTVQIVQTKPDGFILLDEAMNDQKNGLDFVFWETQVSFLDADHICIYQTYINNGSFLVEYKKELYVNEKKFLELVDVADAVDEQRNKIHSLGEDVELRGGDNDYKDGYRIKIYELKKGTDTVAFMINFVITPGVSDYKTKEIFDYVETDKGTIIKEFTFTGNGEVQVTVPTGEKISIIVVKSPDYSDAIRKINVN